MSVGAWILTGISYLVGGIPFGLLIGRAQGMDIRAHGSGNIGATNVARLLGKKWGLLTLLLDIAKGFLPMWITGLVLGGESGHALAVALSGGATVIGHMYSPWLRLQGGKGVATALGVFLYLAPWSVLFSLILFVVAVRWSGFVSMGSLVASAAIPVWLWLLGEPGWKMVLACVVALLIWWKHRANISRLLAGTEKSWNKKEPK